MANKNFQEDYKEINPKLKKYFFTTTNPAITSTYAGELALPYLSAALKSGKTLANNWITIKENIPFKAVLKNATNATLIQDGSCDWTESGTTTLAERILQPEEFMVNTELCKGKFRSDWEALATGSLYDDKIPPTFEEFLLSMIADEVAQSIENSIWVGDNTVSGQFEGLARDTGVIATDGNTVLSGADFTSGTNVLTNLDKLFTDGTNGILANSPAIIDKEDFTIYVSPKVALLYQQKLASDGYLNEYYVNEKPLNYMGYEMVVCPGMSDHRLVAGQKSNLYFGCNTMTDMTSVRVIDRTPIDGSDNVRIAMRYSAGVQIGIANETYVVKEG
tara:strand:- start:13565 stop:14563 length:999 start_codon:yes stop_codon:yes gene_type:complete